MNVADEPNRAELDAWSARDLVTVDSVNVADEPVAHSICCLVSAIRAAFDAAEPHSMSAANAMAQRDSVKLTDEPEHHHGGEYLRNLAVAVKGP